MKTVVSNFDRVFSRVGVVVAIYFLVRGTLAGSMGITNSGFMTLFASGLCYIYSQLCILLYYKYDRYKFQYLLFSRMFVIAALISYFIVDLFVRIYQIWEGSSQAQYVLFPQMDPVIQRWIVGGILVLTGAIGWVFSRFNRKSEGTGQGKNE